MLDLKITILYKDLIHYRYELSKIRRIYSKYNLRRFVDAHRQIYGSALTEIRSGKKQSHWMWYIFPQLRGLGHSRNAEYYGIIDRDEAIMFYFILC